MMMINDIRDNFRKGLAVSFPTKPDFVKGLHIYSQQMETQTIEQIPEKKSVYDKERYEQNKEEILKYRRERHRFSLVSLQCQFSDSNIGVRDKGQYIRRI